MTRPAKFLTVVLFALGLLLAYVAAKGRFPASPAALGDDKVGSGKIARTALPIPEPAYKPITEIDARKAEPPHKLLVR